MEPSDSSNPPEPNAPEQRISPPQEKVENAIPNPGVDVAKSGSHGSQNLPVAIDIRGLTKVFGNTIAVGNLTLAIPRGSFYGIVGPNGAGKTTLLSMATGMLVPDQGVAYIDGYDIWAKPEQAKPLLGVLPDGMRIFDRLSGSVLVTYMGMLRGLDKETAQTRATQLMKALGLQDAGKKPVADYSAGMKKKVTLACALVHGPRILVLDEPFESVDPISSATIREILESFVKGGGTVVLSSHVMEKIGRAHV